MSAKLTEWSRRVADVHRSINNLVSEVQGLLNIPTEGTPTERLATLRSLWKEIGVPEPAEQLDPGKAIMDRVKSALDEDDVKTIAETFAKLSR